MLHSDIRYLDSIYLLYTDLRLFLLLGHRITIESILLIAIDIGSRTTVLVDDDGSKLAFSKDISMRTQVLHRRTPQLSAADFYAVSRCQPNPAAYLEKHCLTRYKFRTGRQLVYIG